ncbi:MAG: outer membrane beta-barrel protein [Tannerella sp.]|nr:outer membrane beta-barrel protein [Tannerella sp.]
MNKKSRESYLEAIQGFEDAGICDAKLLDDCNKRIDECKKAIDALSCVNIYNEGLALMNKKNRESYREAIRKFEEAGKCDAKLRDNCNKRIDECKEAIDALNPTPAPVFVRVSKEKIWFPEQGGVENISVSGDNSWTVTDNANWCVAERGNNLVVITCEPNKSTLPRTAIIEIKGSNNQIKIPVEQAADKEQLSASPSSLTFPAEGKEDVITVYSNTPWEATTALSWCRVEKDDNTIKVKIGVNDSAKERKGDITVKSKTLTQTISVSQGAGREQLSTSSSLTFPAEGKEDVITVSSNTPWEVTTTLSWCRVEKAGNTIKVKVDVNDSAKERKGDITVKSETLTRTISVSQGAGKEQLSAMQSSLTFPAEGKESVIAVSSNTPWEVTTALSWCRVEKDDNTIRVRVGVNDSTKERKGNITVKSKTLTRMISVSQEAGKKPVNVQEKKIENSLPKPEDLSGRKISFGIMANALMPNFSAKASGFTGSAIDYGHRNMSPSYSLSKIGFSGGLVADIRVSKNIYVQTGLYYTNLNIKNVMSGSYDYSKEYYTPTTYLEGKGYDDFTEEYTLNYLEIPILFSYRIPLAEKAMLQINAGPYVGYGLSAKGKIKGTRDYPSLTEYEYAGNRSTGDVHEIKSTVTGEIDMFGRSGRISQVYLTGESPVYSNNDKFKNAPLRNIDAGVSLGTVLEYAGFNLGVYYDMGLMNIANTTYWKSERMRLSLDDARTGMNGYVHKLNKIQIRIGYIFRW